MNICNKCGAIGAGAKKRPGSLVLELLLYGAGVIGAAFWFPLLLLLPTGMVYSVWRHTSSYRVCASCGHKGLVGLDTPEGRNLRDKFANQAR